MSAKFLLIIVSSSSFKNNWCVVVGSLRQVRNPIVIKMSRKIVGIRQKNSVSTQFQSTVVYLCGCVQLLSTPIIFLFSDLSSSCLIFCSIVRCR